MFWTGGILMTAWYTYPIVGDFGQQLQGFTYPVQGEDIETPFHTPITTPFAGTITAAYYDAGGGQVILKADDPSQVRNKIPYFWVAHLDNIFAGLNQHLAAGGTLGISGGQNTGGSHPAAPNYSSGPHTEFGLAKSNSIPYTLVQITPDLNPDWIPAYAQQHAISAGTVSPPTSPATMGTMPTAKQPCQCPPGYTAISIPALGGNWACQNDKDRTLISCTNEPQVTDPFMAISNFIAQISPWLGDPVRIIKVLSGLMLIGLALLLLINPTAGLAGKVAKGVRTAVPHPIKSFAKGAK
jgi:hypothetical protein